jgi:hypothetical protein
VLTAVSVVAATAVLLTWARSPSYRDTIWGELGRGLVGRDSALRGAEDILVWRTNTTLAAVVVAALAAAAFVVATRPWRGLGRV